MNRFTIQFGSGGSFPALKLGSILIVGTGVGMLSNAYSPVLLVFATTLFTIFSISLYASSFPRHHAIAPESTFLSSVEASPKSLLVYLFYFSFFLSITIPKSGKTIASIPITTANVLLLFSLACWVLKAIFSKSLSVRIPLLQPIVVFILYGVIAVVIGVINKNPAKHIILDFAAFIGFVPVYFLVCSVLRTKDQVKNVVWIILISFVIICTYGILQIRIGFEKVAIPGLTEQYGLIIYKGVGRWNVIEGGGSKLYSTFQNGNILGNHLATFIPFLGGIFLSIRSFRNKLFLSGIFLLSCYVLILTYSRGAFLATISGFIMLAIVSKKIRFKAIIAIIVAFVILLGIFWYYAERPEMIRYDYRRIATDPNRFTAGRLERAVQVLEGFSELSLITKLVGLGFGGELVSPLHWRFLYVDNLYLTLLFKMGIIGLVCLLSLLVQLFLTLLKLCRKIDDPATRSLIYGGIAGLVASLIHNLADTLWFFPPLSANFWFLAGITMCIGMIGVRQTEEK